MSSSPTTSPTSPTTGPSTILCDNPALRNAWYAVARSIDVGAAPVGVTVLGTKVVLYRSNATTNAVIAAPDRCPHREAPLSAGRMADGCLVCPYHGWTFGADGRCVRVPSSADNIPAPPRAHLATYPTVEQYGLVWLCVGTSTGDRPDIPIIPNESDQSFRRINTPVDIWQCSATRMSDNFLDVSHFPFVQAPRISSVVARLQASTPPCSTMAAARSRRAIVSGCNSPESLCRKKGSGTPQLR